MAVDRVGGGAWRLYFGLALFCFGRAPFAAFFTYELPRLGSGEAFSVLTEDLASAAITIPWAGSCSSYHT